MLVIHMSILKNNGKTWYNNLWKKDLIPLTLHMYHKLCIRCYEIDSSTHLRRSGLPLSICLLLQFLQIPSKFSESESQSHKRNLRSKHTSYFWICTQAADWSNLSKNQPVAYGAFFLLTPINYWKSRIRCIAWNRFSRLPAISIPSVTWATRIIKTGF